MLRTLIDILEDYEIRILLIIVIGTLSAGTLVYSYFEGWSLFDSFYFSVITLTTVGYGDFSPQTMIGKGFTILYIITGIGIIFGFVNKIAEHAMEHHPIKRIVARKRFKSPEKSRLGFLKKKK